MSKRSGRRKLPSGNLLVSPRWGFNWQSSGEKRWQVRMGAGMFAGQLPYVWLSNAFHNDGRRYVTQLCEGRRYAEPTSPRAVPAYVPGTLPTACLSAPFQEVRSAVVIPEDFRYPQDLKFAVNADRELTDRFSVTAGALFSKAINNSPSYFELAYENRQRNRELYSRSVYDQLN